MDSVLIISRYVLQRIAKKCTHVQSHFTAHNFFSFDNVLVAVAVTVSASQSYCFMINTIQYANIYLITYSCLTQFRYFFTRSLRFSLLFSVFNTVSMIFSSFLISSPVKDSNKRKNSSLSRVSLVLQIRVRFSSNRVKSRCSLVQGNPVTRSPTGHKNLAVTTGWMS